MSFGIDKEKVPKIVMEFDSEEAAYIFYNEYARSVGFSVRRHTVHKDTKGRIIYKTFCCACQSHRQKDKRDVNVNCDRLETLQANDIDNLRIAPRVGFALLAKQVGGRENVGFIFEDYKNYLRSKQNVEMKIGDTGGVLEYLQQKQLDDPNFFYAIQVDEDDLMANILWVDAQMKPGYAHFGDVMCFHTIYRKNKEGRPFALLQTIVFGATLLYNETTSTFSWLFDTFVKAMSGKKPQTILTDQDAIMVKALAMKWPETCRRLCIWHIYQNAVIHLSITFARFASFSKDFGSCIYDYEEEKKQTFCVDLMTTQRSERMNGILKRYVSYKGNLLQLFHHFDRLIEDHRYQELKVDFRTSQSTPVASFPIEILKHAINICTHEVFELFQDEVHKAYDSRVELCRESEQISEYKVTPFRKHYQHTVWYDSSEGKVLCSCKRESGTMEEFGEKLTFVNAETSRGERCIFRHSHCEHHTNFTFARREKLLVFRHLKRVWGKGSVADFVSFFIGEVTMYKPMSLSSIMFVFEVSIY
ncbi:hypothetical protein CDL12_23511 [Handroanthus impetiginosus]|uniref:Protein FAR1-RELATED SEQUENCE n=1 Tax=Handroanthus impetiginosus TaxID=429701 RepID=A0A2G9GFJ1_9LAMI|nr:hypothetical protein CDL12_23511 [Handroanthus impetiginosus]